MDERIYYSLLTALFALQCQFSTFREDRHNQLQNVYDYGNQRQPSLLQENSDFTEDVDDDGNQKIPILPQEDSDFTEDVDDDGNQKIPILPQEDSDLFEMKRSSPVRVRSLPNILNSSKLIDVDFEIIKEAQSLPLPISFKKKDTLEDLLETLRTLQTLQTPFEVLGNMLEDQRQARGTMNTTQRERPPPRPTQHLHQRVVSVMDLTWTETQDQPLHLHQPAPPTVNPTQTERQPLRAHPPLRVRQPSDTAVGPSSAQLENQSRRSTRTMTRVAAPSNSSPPSSWNSISTAMCKMLVVICTAVLPFI